MAKRDEPPRLRIGGDGDRYLYADWSRSRRRLIVSVVAGDAWDRAQQVELRPEQVEQLARWLAAGPDGP